MEENRSREYSRSIVLGKKKLTLDLKESREGFFWRGRARSFHIKGPKMERYRNQQWKEHQAFTRKISTATQHRHK